jgi:predicted PurR-regulated permease PerM
MKTEPSKPLLSELSEADKESIYAEVSKKKRVSNTIVILVALVVGLLLFLLLAFVLPMIIQQQRQQSAADVDRTLSQHAAKQLVEGQQAIKKAVSTTIDNPYYKDKSKMKPKTGDIQRNIFSEPNA